MENTVENAEFIIERLLEFYKVSNVAELSHIINTSQKTISNWKIRNSINAIKKRCRELGIYNDIFGDLNIKIDVNSEINKAVEQKNKTEIDETTLSLFKEAYLKAKNNNNLKGLRIHLLDFNDYQVIQEPVIKETLTVKEFEDMVQNILKRNKKD